MLELLVVVDNTVGGGGGGEKVLRAQDSEKDGTTGNKIKPRIARIGLNFHECQYCNHSIIHLGFGCPAGQRIRDRGVGGGRRGRKDVGRRKKEEGRKSSPFSVREETFQAKAPRRQEIHASGTGWGAQHQLIMATLRVGTAAGRQETRGRNFTFTFSSSSIANRQAGFVNSYGRSGHAEDTEDIFRH